MVCTMCFSALLFLCTVSPDSLLKWYVGELESRRSVFPTYNQTKMKRSVAVAGMSLLPSVADAGKTLTPANASSSFDRKGQQKDNLGGACKQIWVSHLNVRFMLNLNWFQKVCFSFTRNQALRLTTMWCVCVSFQPQTELKLQASICYSSFNASCTSNELKVRVFICVLNGHTQRWSEKLVIIASSWLHPFPSLISPSKWLVAAVCRTKKSKVKLLFSDIS